jgi:hypothetical protein
MDRLFKTKTFNRWSSSVLTDKALRDAIKEMQQGLIDANLGGGVFKKRVACAGKGKRGGARTLLATRFKNRWFFMFGFNKNERENISSSELNQLYLLADDLLSLSDDELTQALNSGELVEIQNDNKE